MKKTYATSMPNHIGAFLKASQCFATLGINITRVSYDKSIDSHMLFLDVEGTEEQIRQADDELEKSVISRTTPVIPASFSSSSVWKIPPAVSPPFWS